MSVICDDECARMSVTFIFHLLTIVVATVIVRKP